MKKYPLTLLVEISTSTTYRQVCFHLSAAESLEPRILLEPLSNFGGGGGREAGGKKEQQRECHDN